MVGVLVVVVVVEALQGEVSGKMPSYVQPRLLLLWTHWTSPCKLGPHGRTSAGAFNYQLLASGCSPSVAWLSFPEGYCTVRRISFGARSLNSEYMVLQTISHYTLLIDNYISWWSDLNPRAGYLY